MLVGGTVTACCLFLGKEPRVLGWVALDAAPEIVYLAANLGCLEFGKR